MDLAISLRHPSTMIVHANMNVSEIENNQKVRYLGTIAALATVLPAIALSFLVALKTFWWCPEGGCSLAVWTDKARFFENIVGVLVLFVVFSLALQFPFVLIARMFYPKKMIEDAFFRVAFPFLGWHDRLMRKWVDLLWRST